MMRIVPLKRDSTSKPKIETFINNLCSNNFAMANEKKYDDFVLEEPHNYEMLRKENERLKKELAYVEQIKTHYEAILRREGLHDELPRDDTIRFGLVPKSDLDESMDLEELPSLGNGDKRIQLDQRLKTPIGRRIDIGYKLLEFEE